MAWSAAIVALVALFGSARVTQLTTRAPSDADPNAGKDVAGTVELFDDTVVHTIDVRYKQGDFDAMLTTLRAAGTQAFVRADVTIDGTALRDVGIRLKGNSTDSATTVDRPETLPWLIQFDEYQAKLRYQGQKEIAIRPAAGSTPRTALDEALSLELIGFAGEPAERVAYSSFTVNGTRTALRLVVEEPGDAFASRNFRDAGVLYKSLAGGRFAYVGDDPKQYASSFKQITAQNVQNLEPLVDLIRWVSQSSDEDFDAELDRHLDVTSFARYLALHNLILNGDDIAGPGQNAYWFYDMATKRFTVITWDTNLAFSNHADRGPLDSGSDDARGGNLLKSRVLASARFQAVYLAEYKRLYTRLFTDGQAVATLDSLGNLLTTKADKLIDRATATKEIEQLRALIAQRTAALKDKV